MTDWLVWIWVPLALAVGIIAAMLQRGQITRLLRRRKRGGHDS